MICVYPADCTDFSTNGKGTLAPLSAEVTETLNDEYELTLVHPIDEAGKWQRLVDGWSFFGNRPVVDRRQSCLFRQSVQDAHIGDDRIVTSSSHTVHRWVFFPEGFIDIITPPE